MRWRRPPGAVPARACVEELLSDVLEGGIRSGRVFGRTAGRDGVPEGCGAVVDREALEVLVRPWVRRGRPGSRGGPARNRPPGCVTPGRVLIMGWDVVRQHRGA
ncbi:hypothetical protein GCM10027174_03500 [Salinifilum aidingensis]